MINQIIEVLKEEYDEINYLETTMAYMLFECDGMEVRAERFYSEHLDQWGVLIEQNNRGWREVTVRHF